MRRLNVAQRPPAVTPRLHTGQRSTLSASSQRRPSRHGYAQQASEASRVLTAACLAAACSRSRRFSTLRYAEPGAATVRPEEVSAPDAPTVGFYETVRSTDIPPMTFSAIRSLGTEGGPAVGADVWVRARVATVRVKGKSTFVVLRQSSLHTVQACKFKDPEDGGESAAAVAKFFKSLPLDSRGFQGCRSLKTATRAFPFAGQMYHQTSGFSVMGMPKKEPLAPVHLEESLVDLHGVLAEAWLTSSLTLLVRMTVLASCFRISFARTLLLNRE